MALMQATQSVIYWAVNYSMTSTERQAWIDSVTPNVKPGAVLEAGVITLANGQRRKAERVAAWMGATLLRYVTPNGRWKTALESDAANFVAS